MLKLTKLLCVMLLCLFGMASANAAVEQVHATFENPSNTNAAWDKQTSSFSWTQSYYNQVRNIGLPTGDLSNYKNLVVDYEILEGDQFRILFYQGGSNLAVFVTKDADGAKGTKTINIYETLSKLDGYSVDFILKCTEVCLSGAGNSGKVKINDMYLETYDEGEQKPDLTPVADEEDPGKPAGDYLDFTEMFPSLQPRVNMGTDGHPIVLGNGDVVVGARSNNVIADLSGYSKITFVTSPNLKLVLYMNHEVEAQQNAGDYDEADAGKYVFMDVQADENGLIEVDLTQFDKQDLNCICLPWDNSNKGTVWYILLTEKEGKTVYLKPGIWDVADATERYAAYMFNDYELNAWADFAAVEGDNGVYSVTIPARYTGIVLCRMNGETTENNWDNKWNQSEDIKDIKDNALYTITGWGEGENAKSTLEESTYEGPTEEPATELANIAALKNFTTEEMGAVPAVLTLTNAKVNFITTKESTDYDDDWNEITVTKDYVLLEDASAGYLLEGSGLGSYVKAGDVLNGKLAISLIDNFGWGIYQTTLTNGIEGVEITEGKPSPIVVTDDNILDYLADNDFRLAQFGDAVINVGDDLAFKSAALGDDPVGIMDTYSILPETIADGAKGVLTGYMASLYGTTFFTPTAFEENAVYTVAGTTDLTGYEWDATQNTMTLDAETGLYIWTAENITVSADAKPEFKIVKNATEWIPENNWVINTDVTGGEGIFTITITYNPATGDIAVTAEKTGEIKPAQIIPNGTYYVLNAAYDEPQLLMAAGHNWGTKGIVNEKGLDLTFTYNESNNTYDIDSRVSNGGNNHFLTGALWMDGASYGWTIEGEFVYTISGTFDGVKKYIAVDENNELILTEDGTADNAQWAFLMKDYWENEVVKAEGLEAMKAATETAPVDATFLIKSPDFNRNDLRNAEVWTMEAGNKNLAGGGEGGNGCAESYHSTFTLSQLLADAPAGVYSLTAQGFYRQDGSDNDNLPYFYANDEKQTFPLRTGTENGMDTAGDSFKKGTYTIEPIYVQVTEAGQLTIGAKLETNTSLWCIWDNFQLKYYGTEADIEQLKNSALYAQVEELTEQLQQLIDSGEIEVDATTTNLTNLLNNVADLNPTSSAELAETAIVILKGGIEIAEGYIKAKNVLPQMKKLTESTNFYTEEALENYYGQWYQKYEAGELTAAEANALQDPFVVTDWRASNTVDDLLMSTWDVAPENWGQYYINTWSVEGATDGTDFAVPFFEYWTGDDATLAEKTLTGTVSNLEPGTYGVSAWVRVRGKNNFTRPAYGITMQVNNGTAIDAAASTEVPNSNFYVGQMSAIGEVGEDGRLTLKFNVAADNNISWLSFKNVKYNKMQTFTANFENEDTWEKVYAYTWTGGEYDKVEQLGAWPGTEITATADENGVYTVTIPGIEAPANIIFSNGLEGEGHIQTEDFVFEDGKTYQYILPATDIVVTPETGADIYAAVEAEKATVKKVGSISIVLAEGGSYTVSAPLVAYKNLEIQANGATIDANELTGNFIEMATTKDPTVKVPVEFVSIHNATVKGLKKPLFFSTQKGYLIEWLTIDNSIVEVAADVTSIDFTKGSAVRNFNIENSTVYAPVATTKSFFSSQAGQKLTELDAEGIQSFIIKNATMYNLATGKNFFTHRQNSQKWLTFVAENNIFVNCGKNGQAIKGMNGGGSSTNPTWTVSGNVFNFEVEGVMTDTSAAEETGDAEEPIQNSYALVMTFVDPAGGDFNADFTAAEDATIPTEKIGDPRWTLNYKAPEIEDGYYLVGNMNEWKPSAKYKLELNDGAEGVEEYMITIDLAADAQFKVVKVEGETQTFYPDGLGNAYGENGELTKGRGEYNVYFRPNADGGEDWFYGVLYVIDTTTDGINRVTIDTNKTAVYNMQGQKVMKTRKGLYIVNGKKVVLK